MITEQRNPKRLRRQRDVLVETVYEIARIECRRLAGAPSAEFRKAVDALEEFDAAETARTERNTAGAERAAVVESTSRRRGVLDVPDEEDARFTYRR